MGLELPCTLIFFVCRIMYAKYLVTDFCAGLLTEGSVDALEFENENSIDALMS